MPPIHSTRVRKLRQRLLLNNLNRGNKPYTFDELIQAHRAPVFLDDIDDPFPPPGQSWSQIGQKDVMTETDEKDQLRHRVMAEVQAVDWAQLTPLRLHPNYCGTHLYDCAGIVKSTHKLYAFSKEPVHVNQVFEINVNKPTSGKVYAGFTARDPASLEPGSMPDDAEKLLERPDYFKIAGFITTSGFKIVMKIKPDGEVLVMFGEQDLGSFSIDVLKQLWLLVQSPVEADFALKTTISTYDYVPSERPIPRGGLGMTAGVPHGEKIKEFHERALSELVCNCDWNKGKNMVVSQYGHGTTVSENVGIVTIKEGNEPFFAFSGHCVEDNQVYEILAVRRPNNKNQRLLYIGFTARNPSSLESSRLPTGPQLYERPDYWEFTCFDMEQADTVYLKMKPDGEVLVMFGDLDLRSFRVDRGAPLWLFMHGTGGVQELSCRTIISNYTYKKPLTKSSGSPSSAPDDRECLVCFGPVNSALVSCGHSCLCLPCAERVQTNTGLCPVCRRRIERVIRLYL